MVLVATDRKRLEATSATVRNINPTIKTVSVVTDISNVASVDNLFREVQQSYGHADILVNNAGIHGAGRVVHEEDPTKWWHDFVCFARTSPANRRCDTSS